MNKQWVAAGVASVSLLGASQATAQVGADALCPALNRIMATARTTPLWQGIETSNFRGTLVPNGFDQCGTLSASAAEAYFCTVELTGSTIEARYRTVIAELNTCLGLRPAMSEDRGLIHATWKPSGSMEVVATKNVNVNYGDYNVTVAVRLPY